MQDNGSRRILQGLVENLEQLRARLGQTPPPETELVLQAIVPAASQIYQSVRAQTLATVARRDTFFAWLNQRMAAVTVVVQKLKALGALKVELLGPATKLRELIGQIAPKFFETREIHSLENIILIYGFALVEKIYRAKYREILMAARDDLQAKAETLGPRERERRDGLEKVYPLFPRLQKGVPPALAIRVIDTDEEDPTTVEQRDLDALLTLLQEQGFVEAQRNLKRYSDTFCKPSVHFEVEFVASPALRVQINRLLEEKARLEKLRDAPADSEPQKRIRELENNIRILYKDKYDLIQLLEQQQQQPRTATSVSVSASVDGLASPTNPIPAALLATTTTTSAERQGELDTLRVKYDTLKKKNTQLKEWSRQLETQPDRLDELQRQLKQEREDKAELKRKNEDLQRLLEDTEARHAKMVQSLVGSGFEFTESDDSGTSTFVAPIPKVNWEERFVRLDLEAKEQQERFQRQAVEATALNATLTGKAEALSKQVEILTRQLGERSLELQQHAQATQAEVTRRKAEVDSLAARLQGREAELVGQLDQSRQLLATEGRRTTETISSLQTREQELATIRGELAQRTTSLAEISRGSEVAHSQLSELRTQVDQLQIMRQNTTQVEENYVAEIKTMRRKLAETEELQKRLSEAEKLNSHTKSLVGESLGVIRYLYRLVHECSRLLQEVSESASSAPPRALLEDNPYLDGDSDSISAGRDLHDLLQYCQQNIVHLGDYLRARVTELGVQASSKLSVDDFKINDRVLFLPTQKNTFLAFTTNTKGPQYELSPDVVNSCEPRVRYIIGQIIMIEPNDEYVSSHSPSLFLLSAQPDC